MYKAARRITKHPKVQFPLDLIQYNLSGEFLSAQSIIKCVLIFLRSHRAIKNGETSLGALWGNIVPLNE